MKLIQTAAFGVAEFEMKPQANYRPRISAEHLSRLWLLKQRTKKPISKIVSEALDFYFDNLEEVKNK
jgi:predicted DNA-binding protein